MYGWMKNEEEELLTTGGIIPSLQSTSPTHSNQSVRPTGEFDMLARESQRIYLVIYATHFKYI